MAVLSRAAFGVLHDPYDEGDRHSTHERGHAESRPPVLGRRTRFRPHDVSHSTEILNYSVQFILFRDL